MVLARDLEKTMSLLRRLYDLIVVDAGVGLDEVTLSLLDQADTILSVVTYDGTTIRNTVAMAETFAKIGYPAAKLQYVLNRSDASGGIEPAELRARLGRDPDHHVRSDGPVVVAAGNRGQAFVQANPDALVSRDILEIARQLVPPHLQAAPRNEWLEPRAAVAAAS
jgi:pilus assembly protein CpaE